MSEEFEFQSALANPEAATAAIAAALSEDVTRAMAQEVSGDKIPDAPEIRDSAHKLPAGVAIGNEVLRDVVVRELTGRDEEKIAKARAQGNLYRWFNAVLLCGIESIGGKAPTTEVIDAMLIGDRDFVLTKIRMATFGETVEFGDWVCPECLEEFKAEVDLKGLEMKPLKDDERQFTVQMNKGREAIVRVPLGADQSAFLAVEDESLPAKNTALLERVVEAIAENGGKPMPIIGMAHSAVLNLGIADRSKILDSLAERQPGPRYDDVKVIHSCGAKIPAPIGLVSLFPGL